MRAVLEFESDLFMRGSLTIDEFARLTHIQVEEIERYREAGVLDTDGDGRFDEYDVLGLRFLKVTAADQPPEEAARRIDELADQNRCVTCSTDRQATESP